MAQLDSILKDKPDHTGALAYKALTLASKDKPDQAAALFEQLLGLHRLLPIDPRPGTVPPTS